MEPDHLVSTTRLARVLGLSPRSIQRYTKAGVITPEFTTPGGHHRYDPVKVREQLREYQRRAREAEDSR